MSIRSAGAIKFALGTAGAVVVGFFVAWLRGKGYSPNMFAMIPLALPGAWALTGLLEMIAGVPFSQVAQKWDELAGWQRGVLGVLVVIVAFVVMGALMIAFG